MGPVLRARQRMTKSREAMVRLHATFASSPITLEGCREKGLVEEFDRARNSNLIVPKCGNGDGTKSYELSPRAHDYLARRQHV